MSTPSNAADRIELMQTFVRIVEAGSLSAAAAQLGTTQPTISRRLQALERMLGLRLLQRSTHAMQLTEDGERCLAHARELLSHWTALASDVQDAREEPAGCRASPSPRRRCWPGSRCPRIRNSWPPCPSWPCARSTATRSHSITPAAQATSWPCNRA